MTQDSTTHLTLHRGGRLTPREFSLLPLDEKVRHLRARPAKEQLDLIIADPAGEKIVREFPRLDLYLLVKELGESDALELIQFSSPEQFVFMLDLEIWNRWEFSRARALQWLGYLLEGGEEPVAAFFGQADPELLTLIFMEEISVGGGLGLLETDEERLADWDHSFDSLYFITFTHRQTSEAVGRLLDILFRPEVADAVEWPGRPDGFDGILIDAPCTSTGRCRPTRFSRWIRLITPRAPVDQPA